MVYNLIGAVALFFFIPQGAHAILKDVVVIDGRHLEPGKTGHAVGVGFFKGAGFTISNILFKSDNMLIALFEIIRPGRAGREQEYKHAGEKNFFHVNKYRSAATLFTREGMDRTRKNILPCIFIMC